MFCYGKSETPDSSKGKLSGVLLIIEWSTDWDREKR